MLCLYRSSFVSHQAGLDGKQLGRLEGLFLTDGTDGSGTDSEQEQLVVDSILNHIRDVWKSSKRTQFSYSVNPINTGSLKSGLGTLFVYLLFGNRSWARVSSVFKIT